MFGKTPRVRFVVGTLLTCFLVLSLATFISAKPRKKSKKQKETAARKAARLNREIAIRRAILLGASISQANAVGGDFSVSLGSDISVRTNSVTANTNNSGALFVGDPEAAAPGLGPAAASAGQLLISEFRVRGPNGVNDEFIEIYNNSGADHTVADSGVGTGYAVAASNGIARCVIPNGTVIPNRGHFLCVNSIGYSLSTYPAGNGTTATGDLTYTIDIPDNAGIAIFNTSVPANFTLANRIDAVGSTSEANTLYKEGTGYPALTPFSINYSLYRDNCGKSGSITTVGTCPIENPKDTDNNAADFVFVDTNATPAGAGQRLGAPGPENLSSPIQRNASISASLLDTCIGRGSPPNQVRDLTSVPAQFSTFGTVDIRRTFTNNTGANVTRLRFRIVDLTTFPAPSGTADLRALTSLAVVVVVDRPPCGAGTSNVTVQGTTLEQPPSHPVGGGFNSTLSAGTVTLATPIANGATIDLRFVLGVQQTGTFKIYVNVEALP